jgi:hypothetical protein
MNSAWGRLYDPLKDRVYGAIFILTQMALVGLLVLGVILYAKGLLLYILQATPCMAVGVGVWGYRRFRFAKLRASEPCRYPPLSVLEVRAARSKLVKRKGAS